MQCPKCGSSQPVTNKECATCGIIFDRWQPRAPRKTTASFTPVPAAPVVTESAAPKLSTPFILVALVLVAIGGFMWTKHSREAREKSGNSTDALINQINNSGSKLRSDLQNRGSSGKRGGAVWASSVSPRSKLPADLDEAKIRDLIEGCSFFQTDVNVDIPKQIDGGRIAFGVNRAAILGIAAQQHLIEFDPPLEGGLRPGEIVNVKVTQYASAKVTVSDNGDSYRFGLGRRHVTLTNTRYVADNAVSATFTWSLDQSDVAALSPEGPNPSGGADLRRSGNTWGTTRVWQDSGGGLRYICQ